MSHPTTRPTVKRKRFGQHFLKDQTILQRILKTIAPQSSDHIVEIGPGKGALTTWLLTSHCHLSLIEIDRDLCDFLNHRFTEEKILTLYQGDVLKFDFSTLGSALRVVGNLPYNISTPLLFKLLDHLSLIVDMHFMFQYEVAKRLVAPVGGSDYGRLSVMVQYFCHNCLLFEVPPEAFSPPPRVVSAFVQMIPRTDREPVDTRIFAAVVREAFSHRRKNISNALKALIDPRQLSKVIDPTRRPQELTVEDFIKICKIFM